MGSIFTGFKYRNVFQVGRIQQLENDCLSAKPILGFLLHKHKSAAVLLLLLLSPFSLPAVGHGNTIVSDGLPAGVSRNWWRNVKQHIRDSEYNISVTGNESRSAMTLARVMKGRPLSI